MEMISAHPAASMSIRIGRASDAMPAAASVDSRMQQDAVTAVRKPDSPVSAAPAPIQNIA